MTRTRRGDHWRGSRLAEIVFRRRQSIRRPFAVVDERGVVLFRGTDREQMERMRRVTGGRIVEAGELSAPVPLTPDRRGGARG